MEYVAHRRGPVALLVGLVLLVTVAGILCLLPLANCPRCEFWAHFRYQGGGPGYPMIDATSHIDGDPCPRCGDRSDEGRITLINKWFWEPRQGKYSLTAGH